MLLVVAGVAVVICLVSVPTIKLYCVLAFKVTLLLRVILVPETPDIVLDCSGWSAKGVVYLG